MLDFIFSLDGEMNISETGFPQALEIMINLENH